MASGVGVGIDMYIYIYINCDIQRFDRFPGFFNKFELYVIPSLILLSHDNWSMNE